jgi:hypothetical protein
MAGSRTLKLSILADVDDLKKNLKTGEKEVEGFGGKLEKFSKVAAAAFAAAAAAAAAYAGKLAIEGVKAAIEDEAAQKRLALALENVTDATDAQIAAVEEQIRKTSLATGVADDRLRPALQRLAVATGSVEKSQELLNIALDVSAATGKDVETVSNALGRAYEGNTSSLSRLGIGLSTAEIKTLGLEGAINQLSTTFGGAAATQADTFEGRIARLQVAFDEAKETVGTALLPIIEKLLTFITDTAIPKFQELKATAVDPIIIAFKNNEDALRDLWKFAKDFLIPLFGGALINAVKGVATAVSGIVNIVATVVTSIKNLANDAINIINSIIRAYNAIPVLPNIGTIPNIGSSSGPGTNTVSPGSLPFGGSTGGSSSSGAGSGSGRGTSSGGSGGAGSGSGSGSASGSSSASSTPVFSIPEIGNPSEFVRDFIGYTDTGGGAFGGRGNTRPDDGGGDITIVVQAPTVIDEEGFSRAVVDALNQATNRGTGGGGGLRDTAQVL